MRLWKLEISGYRSVSNTLTLIFDPNVTVLLGANDHGKTNILHAITHLNSDVKFDADRDLNWDHVGLQDEYPFLRFEFTLDAVDREELLEIANELERKRLATAAAAATAPSAAVPSTTPPASSAASAAPTAATSDSTST